MVFLGTGTKFALVCPICWKVERTGRMWSRALLGSAERHQEICGEAKKGTEYLRKRPREEMKNVSVGKPLSWSVQKEFFKPDFLRRKPLVERRNGAQQV